MHGLSWDPEVPFQLSQSQQRCWTSYRAPRHFAPSLRKSSSICQEISASLHTFRKSTPAPAPRRPLPEIIEQPRDKSFTASVTVLLSFTFGCMLQSRKLWKISKLSLFCRYVLWERARNPLVEGWVRKWEESTFSYFAQVYLYACNLVTMCSVLFSFSYMEWQIPSHIFILTSKHRMFFG